jgi:quercetin dioxygenase-like cupin family protein
VTTRAPIAPSLGAAIVVAIAVLLTLTSGHVDATPGSGATSTILASGTSPEDVKVHTKGPTDFVFVEVTIEPGGFTGWHTHPGPLLVAVQSGTLTRYLADCRVETNTAGDSFIEHAGRRAVHMGVNNGSEPVVLLVTYVVPAGGPLRNEAAEPSCTADGLPTGV